MTQAGVMTSEQMECGEPPHMTDVGRSVEEGIGGVGRGGRVFKQRQGALKGHIPGVACGLAGLGGNGCHLLGT